MKIILEFHTQHSTRHLAGTDELCACSTRTLRVSGLAKMEYYLQHTTHDICVTYDVPKLLGIYPSSSEKKKRKTDAKFSPLWLRFCTCDVYLKKNGKGDKKSCFGPANSSTKIKSNIQTEQLSPCPLLLLISPALNSIYESTDLN